MRIHKFKGVSKVIRAGCRCCDTPKTKKELKRLAARHSRREAIRLLTQTPVGDRGEK